LTIGRGKKKEGGERKEGPGFTSTVRVGRGVMYEKTAVPSSSGGDYGKGGRGMIEIAVWRMGKRKGTGKGRGTPRRGAKSGTAQGISLGGFL